MHKGLVIASALLAASCNAAPDQQAVAADVANTNRTDDTADGPDAPSRQAATSPSFAILVATTDLFEIASGTLAMKNGQSAETREFAKMLVDDHTASLRDLMVAAKQSDVNVVLPTQLDAQQQGLLDRLAQANAADFDREFTNQQLDEHRTALKLHQEYQATTDNAELLAVSKKVLPVIQAHYDRLEEYRVAQGWESNAPAPQ